MTHHRTVIRQTAVDVIAQAATFAGANVYNSRVRDMVLPAITVFTDPDELADDGQVLMPGNTRQIRNLTLRVEMRSAETMQIPAADSLDERSTGGKCLVSNRFDWQTKPRPARQQSILGIALYQ